MKNTITAALAVLGLILLLVGAAVMQTAPDTPPAPPASPTPPTLSTSGKLIQAAARAYKDAPAFTDLIEITFEAPNGTRRDEVSVALGKGTEFRLQTKTDIVTAIDGRLYLQRIKMPDKYVVYQHGGNLLQKLKDVTRLPTAHVGLRHGKNLTDFVHALGLSMVRDVRLVGEQMVQYAGKPHHELQLEAARGVTIKVLLDPETKFIVSHELKSKTATLRLTMTPRRYEQLPEPIVFRSEGRRAVATPADLALGEGDLAPDFTLPTLDGQTVTLSDLRGSVVVLDFWASWCPPCRRSLPLLDKFATWARTEGAPVEVFAVNFGEKRPTAEGRREIATRYWKQTSFAVPVLLDLDNSVATAFEVGPIPHTVVIDPNGTIIKVEVGLNMRMTSHLKELTHQALGESG